MSDIGAAHDDGRLPNMDAVLPIRWSEISAGDADGTRALDITPWDGIAIRILPDRGFDLGQAWYRGVPLAWASVTGETAPLDDLSGMNWATGFGGGLLVTCGLRNVGMASEGHGLHGTYSHLPASGVAVDRIVDADGTRAIARGTIDDPAGPQPLRLSRTITTWAGRGRVDVTDVTTNLGTESEPAPILYHFNFGFPLWGTGASLEIPASEIIPRDDDSLLSLDNWREPQPVQEGPERVLEHLIEAAEGWSKARISNPAVGVAVTLRWRVAELPRLHQWVNPSPGMAVLGVEPANCSTSGRGFDRDEGRLPVLEPGEERETKVVVEAEGL